MKELKIEVTVTFDEDNIRSVCDAIHSGDKKRGGELLDKLKADPAMFSEFAQDIKDTPFIDEIIEASADACGGDWLNDYYIEDES